MVAQKKLRQRKSEAYYRRRDFCMTERIRVRIEKEIPDELKRWRQYRMSFQDEDLSDDELDSLIKEASLRDEKVELKYYPAQYFIPLPKVVSKHIKIAGLQECKEKFAFTEPELLEMRARLAMDPAYYKCGYVFTGDEILLAGLYRLHNPNKLGDEGACILLRSLCVASASGCRSRAGAAR